MYRSIQGLEERYKRFHVRLGALHVRCAGFIVYQVPTALVGTGGLTTRMTRMTEGPGWRRGSVVSPECRIKYDGTYSLQQMVCYVVRTLVYSPRESYSTISNRPGPGPRAAALCVWLDRVVPL